MSTVEAELLAIEHRWLEAFRNGDAATLDEIWSDDFVFTDPDGGVLTKAACLEAIRSGAFHFDVVKEHRLNVRVTGDTAVVLGHVELVGRVGKRRYGGRYSVLDVYARRDGRWVAVLSSGERAKALAESTE